MDGDTHPDITSICAEVACTEGNWLLHSAEMEEEKEVR